MWLEFARRVRVVFPPDNDLISATWHRLAERIRQEYQWAIVVTGSKARRNRIEWNAKALLALHADPSLNDRQLAKICDVHPSTISRSPFVNTTPATGE